MRRARHLGITLTKQKELVLQLAIYLSMSKALLAMKKLKGAMGEDEFKAQPNLVSQ